MRDTRTGTGDILWLGGGGGDGEEAEREKGWTDELEVKWEETKRVKGHSAGDGG